MTLLADRRFRSVPILKVCNRWWLLSPDSPMDMSLVEGEEKLVEVHQVPDYVEEIHTYLREMEVRA